MGDDGEKFGSLAHHLGALLGREPLGRPLLRRARGERRLAHDDHPVGLAGRQPADRPGLPADRLVRRDGRVGAAARREPGLRRPPPPGRGGRRSRVPLPARRLLAQLPGEVPRDQRPPQADAADVGQGRGDARRAGEGGRPRPPLPGPVERLLLARPLRRHLHQPHAPGHLRAPDRRRGRGRPRGPGGRRGRRRRPRRGRRPRRRPRGRPRDRGPGRRGQALRGRRDRELGHPGGAPRARGGPAPPTGGRPTRPSSSTSEGSPSRAAPAAQAGGRRLHPRPGEHEGVRPRGPAPLRHVRAPLRASSTCWRPGTTPGAFARADVAEYGDFVARPFRVEATGGEGGAAGSAWSATGSPARRPAPCRSGSRRRSRPAATAARRPCRSRSAWRTAARARSRRRWPSSGPRRCWAGAATRPPTTSSTASACPTTRPAAAPRSASCARATTTWASTSRPGWSRAAETWISPIDTVSNSEAGFERVYQGSALVFAWPLVLAPGAATTVRMEHTVTTTRDRAAEEGLREPR